MNPLTNMKNVVKLSEQELYTSNKTSWHDQYKNSAWIFVGGLPYALSEGDIICVFSQYGEIVNINLIRDKDTGKPKGFCFICYEDQRSTVLAVDNFNGIKILNRIIRVDHVNEYKVPKDGKKTDEETKQLYEEGCAPKAQAIEEKIKPKNADKKLDPYDVRETLADQIVTDIKLPARLPIYPAIKQENIKIEDDKVVKTKKDKKRKKDKKINKKKKSKKAEEVTDDSSSESEPEKKKHRKKKRKRRNSSSDDSSSSDEDEDGRKSKKNRKKTARNKSVDKNEGNRSKSWNRSPERRSSSVEINRSYRNPSVEKTVENNYKARDRSYDRNDKKYSTYQRSENYYNQNRRR